MSESRRTGMKNDREVDYLPCFSAGRREEEWDFPRFPPSAPAWMKEIPMHWWREKQEEEEEEEEREAFLSWCSLDKVWILISSLGFLLAPPHSAQQRSFKPAASENSL